MRDAFFSELTRLGQSDQRIIFLTGDLGYKLFDDFAARCPGRCYNMGVSEANMVSVAAGLALAGMRPVTYSIATFATVRCLEQIRNDVCNMNLPVLIVGVGGGYTYGVNGATHHGVDDVAVMRAMPGMTILCPCDPVETREALTAALSLDGPVYLRLGRNKEPQLTWVADPFVIGRPRVLRLGEKVAILACGPIVKEALEAAEWLAAYGLSPLVLSVHTVKPIEGLVAYLRAVKASHLFILEEHGPCGGLAEAVAIEFADLEERPLLARLSAPDHFFHKVGSQAFMRHIAGIDAAAIGRTIADWLEVYP